MSKRKLNRRQAWRVEKIQRERAERAQKRDARAAEALGSGDLGPEQEGLITAHYGTQVEVEHAPGASQRCHIRANIEALVTGDRVIWREGPDTGVVVAQQPRSSELCRPDPYGKLKPVAANIDQILIVVAAAPTPHAQIIDRYIVAAETVDISPIILFNKVDLLADEPAIAAMQALVDPFEALSYPTLRASTRSESGMEALYTSLRGKTSVLVGQSGVGKSSLINTLLPDEELRVGALSEATGKGTHTTTTAQLFHMPCGGRLIDSPGIREFGLWHMSRDEIEAGFTEIHALAAQCRFRDCQHEGEPGCAVLAAVERGELQPRRLESFRHLVASLEG